MSDHDAAPDPLDKAYAQAEAVLTDDSARAARRARVLAAVAQATPEGAAPRRRPAWPLGGWLAAASVAGLSALLATQVQLPIAIEKPAAPTPPAAPAATADASSNAPPPAPGSSPKASMPPPRPSAVAPETEAPAREVAKAEAPPPPLQVARAPRPEATPAGAPAAPALDAGLSEVVVTASRREPARASPRAASFAGSPADLAEKLRDAAARGRTAEVAALLAKGAPVDDPDDDGDTALMKSVQANHPAAAALLRRHGASLDRQNRAGESARDMAMSVGDAELDRALDLDR